MKKILIIFASFMALNAIDVGINIGLPNISIHSGGIDLWDDEYRGYRPYTRRYYAPPPPPPPPPPHVKKYYKNHKIVKVHKMPPPPKPHGKKPAKPHGKMPPPRR